MASSQLLVALTTNHSLLLFSFGRALRSGGRAIRYNLFEAKKDFRYNPSRKQLTLP